MRREMKKSYLPLSVTKGHQFNVIVCIKANVDVILTVSYRVFTNKGKVNVRRGNICNPYFIVHSKRCNKTLLLKIATLTNKLEFIREIFQTKLLVMLFG